VPVVGDAMVGDESIRGWVDVLHPVLYPIRAERRRPQIAPGCPPFTSDDSVLDRGKVDIGPEQSVAPGLHRPEVGEHTVVWWDPRALPLDRERSAGLRQQRILKADERGARNDGGELRHAAWRARQRTALSRGGEPSQRVRTATEISSAIGEALYQAGGRAEASKRAGNVTIERTSALREGRPRGKRFGVLVHAALAEVSLGANEAEAAAMAVVQGRLIGATLDEVNAAKEAIVAALAHPLVMRAAKAAARGECRRETPVVMPLDDGGVLDGVIDLAFREESASGPVWFVVDFKTDSDVEAHGAAYETQVSLYMQAVERSTGERAQGVLLSV
jgi:ATP-dependent helicase/nuclease subunit A